MGPICFVGGGWGGGHPPPPPPMTMNDFCKRFGLLHLEAAGFSVAVLFIVLVGFLVCQNNGAAPHGPAHDNAHTHGGQFFLSASGETNVLSIPFNITHLEPPMPPAFFLVVGGGFDDGGGGGGGGRFLAPPA